MIEIMTAPKNRISTMNGEDSLFSIRGFLHLSSDVQVADKWLNILRKPYRTWSRLDVFDLWIGNILGEKNSTYYSRALKSLIAENQWPACSDVSVYLVGRNRNNGFYKMSFVDSIAFPMVEGVIIDGVDSGRAICISQHGDIRIFNGFLS